MFQFLIDTLIRALDLALISVALSGVYALIKFPNVALVQYSVVGAFVGMALQTAGLPLPLAIVLATLFVGVMAVLFNVLLFERLLEAGSPIALIGSLALSMMLSAVFLVVFGPVAYRFDLAVAPAMRVLGARITEHQLSTLAITVVALGGFAAILFLTRLGREMRATSTNRVLAAASGIDTRRVINLTVFLSGILAALGGITLAMRGSVSIDLGTQMLLPVFAAAILGGLGNALGAIAGALVISAAETFVTNTNFGPLVGEGFYFLPASYAQTVSFAILVLFLLFRPSGLFTSEVKRV